MEEKFCNWKEEEDGILGMGKVAYHEQKEKQHADHLWGLFLYRGCSKAYEKGVFIW